MSGYFENNKIPLSVNKADTAKITRQACSTRLTKNSRYMDILNGMLLFGEEKFSPTARPIREGTVFTQEDIKKEKQALSSSTPYSTTENHGLDPTENSISLVKGVTVSLPGGFRLDITASGMDQSGDIRLLREREEAVKIADALNSLIKMANGQVTGHHFYQKGEQNTKYALMGLAAAGIDINRDFTVNGTHFTVSEGILVKTAQKKWD